jgi:hypothetical protein
MAMYRASLYPAGPHHSRGATALSQLDAANADIYPCNLAP